MNKLIEKELRKCVYAQVPYFDDNTTTLVIEKTGIHKKLEARVGAYFQIEIEDLILNPGEGNTLSSNWNKGTVPPCKHMNICCIQVMGKMFKVDGVGVNIETGDTLDCFWTGWLPQTSVKFLKEITE